MSADPTPDVVAQLKQAINAHDVDAVVSCFAPDYRNETPAHPARNFTGPEQVRRNWTEILAGVPDLTASVIAVQPGPQCAWVEWRWAGTRRDGTPLRVVGVTVLAIDQGLIQSARFYMEPVDDDRATYDTVIPAQVGAAPGHREATGAR